MEENKILATVDGFTITEADVDAFIGNLPKEQQAFATNPQFREQALEQIITVHLYAKMAEEEKLDETEMFKKLIASARKDILAQLAMNEVLGGLTISDEEAKKFYEENQNFFQKGESVSAKHILVKEEEQAVSIMNAITSGEKTFEAAAMESSTCPSSAQGGDLGEFTRGQMVPEFEEAAFSAEVGQIVGPVKTQFGFHLIKVEKKNEASVADFSEVESSIKANLLQQKQFEVYTQKVAELREKYLAK